MPAFEQQQSRTQSSLLANPARPDRVDSRLTSVGNPLLDQHQTLGNQTVQRLLNSHVIPAKLTVNQPGDQYEQEADRVADAVMRMPDPGATKGAVVSEQVPGVRVQQMCSECEEELHRQPLEEAGAVLGQIQTPVIQRVCSECEGELRRQPVEKEEEILQTKEVPGHTAQLTPDIEANIDALRGSSEPLPQSVRAFFGPHFGRDFSQVRVHRDARAAESARAVNALAYTVGQDIVFGAAQYAPQSPEGRTLLAHELMRVLQQTVEPSSSIHRSNIGSSKGVSEREADKVARQVGAENGSQPVASSNSALTRAKQRIQRQATPGPGCADPFHRCKLQDSLGHAKQMVSAVLAELPRIATGAVTAGRIIDLLNVHFHSASANNAARILDNFRQIESELNAPLRYICHSDVPPECEGPAGGFTDCGAPGSDVHLCAPYFVSFTCEQRARALVHEAAHHVPGFLCRNETYLGDPDYMTLPPEQAMRNPDTHAQFAAMVFPSALRCRDCAAEVQRRGRS